MVTEINEKEIMMLRELKKKYSTKWFRYVIMGDINPHNPDDDMCYTILLADSEEELYEYPNPVKGISSGGITCGNNAPFTPEVGGVYIHA